MNIKLKNQDLEHILKSLKDLPESSPDPIFRRNAKIRIMNKIGASPLKVSRPAEAEIFGWMRGRPLSYALASLLLFLLVGAGTVAAGSSLPGERLYPVKIAGEKIILLAAPTPELKSKVTQGIIERRQAEIRELKERGREDLAREIEKTLADTVDQVQEQGFVDKAQPEKPQPEKEKKQEPPGVKEPRRKNQPANYKNPDPPKQPRSQQSPSPEKDKSSPPKKDTKDSGKKK